VSQPPDGSAPVAEYQIAALQIACPHCGGTLMGLHGSALIVRADGFRPGQVVACEDCHRPYRLPGIISELRQ
jgi:hypothetical protein